MRWTEEEYTEFVKRKGDPVPFHLPANDSGHFALGRLSTGVMNKTEAAYAKYLEEQKQITAVVWWKFEAIKLRLADKTFYTCDFAVLPKSGYLEMHEVKGFMQEDANVKIKVAASMYPFKFIIVRKRKEGWEFEDKP